jgi:hypothetical protein
VLSHYEFEVTGNPRRLSDQEWQNVTGGGFPADLEPKRLEGVPRPAFGDWAASTGLTTQFPNASAEGDDPDGDGFTNGAEWFAATDPTQRASRLELEPTPRPADLAASCYFGKTA